MFGGKHTKELELPPFQGLTAKGGVDGGFTRFVNVKVVDGKLAIERRKQTDLVSNTTGIPAGWGIKNLHELRKIDGTRYVFVDIPEKPGLSIDAPAAAPTLAETTGGSMFGNAYSSITYKSGGTEGLGASEKSVKTILSLGNDFCNLTKFSNEGEDHTDWGNYTTYYRVEIDGKAYNSDNEKVATYAYGSIELEDGGTGYTSGNLVFDNTGTGGTGAAGTFVATAGVITSISITDLGDGYTSAPSVDGDAGGNADATLNVVWREDVPVEMCDFGKKYGSDFEGHPFSAPIGHSSTWFNYSDVIFSFESDRQMGFGDNWVFSLNCSERTRLTPDDVTFALGGLDDLSTSGDYDGDETQSIRIVVTEEDTPDTFAYYIDGYFVASGVDMVASPATLTKSNVTITWGASTGHTEGSSWEFYATAGKYTFYYTYATYTGSVCTGETNPSDATSVIVDSNNNAVTVKWTDTADTYDKVRIYRTLVDDDSGDAYFCGTGTKGAGTTGVDITEADEDIVANDIMISDLQGNVLISVASATNTSTEADGVTVSAFTTQLARLTTDIDIVPCWANMNDYAYRCDGTNKLRVFSDATTNSAISGIDAPKLAPVLVNEYTLGKPYDSDGLLDGEYDFCYTFGKKDSDTGEYMESNPSPKRTINVGTPIVSVTIPEASSQEDVDYVRIYRSALGAPTVLYPAIPTASNYGWFGLNESPYKYYIMSDDNEIIGTIVLQENNDPPPVSRYIEVAGARMWYAYLPEEENGEFLVRYSKYNKPESVDNESELEFDPDDGDVITGMKAWRGTLLIFKRKAFYMIDDVFASSPGRRPRHKKIGCIDNRTIAATGNNTLIWMSEEGVVEYDGNNVKLIDRFPDGKDKVGSLVETYIDKGAEFFGVYYNKNREYYSLMCTRNSTETSLVLNKQLVYQLGSETWSEYQYKDSDGDREYPTCMGIITDDKDREILVMSTITGLTGTTGHLTEVDKDDDELGENKEILDSAGDGTTACDAPKVSCVDSDDNVYVMAGTAIFKIAVDTDVVTEIVQITDLVTAGGFLNMTIDTENEYLYLWHTDTSLEVATYHIVRSTYSGTTTSVSNTGYTIGDTILSVDSDGSLYFVGVASSKDNIVQVSDPGGGSEAVASLYASSATTDVLYGLKIDSSDNMYFAEHNTGTDISTFKKLTDVTGSATESTLFTESAVTAIDLVVVSSTEIYFLDPSEDQDDTQNYVSTLYKASYADSEWTVTACSSAWSDWDIDTGTVADVTAKVTNIVLDDNSDLVFTYYDPDVGVTSTKIYRVYLDEEDVMFVTGYAGFSGSGIETAAGLSTLSNDSIIVCGYGTDNAFRVKDSGYWDDPTLDGDSWKANSWFDIQSCYTDLGSLPTQKVMRKVYFEGESKYVCCGELYVQSDYDTLREAHVSGESSDPSAGTESGDTWITRGEMEFHTTERFDDDDGTPAVKEHKERCEIPIYITGDRIRYMIHGGTHNNSYNGKLKLGAPTLAITIRGKTSE